MKECEWIDRDGDKNFWVMGCIHDMWILKNETPKEAGMNYCPSCGGKIKIVGRERMADK